jgi:hypothetical protein
MLLCLDITETVCIVALKDHSAALDKLKRLEFASP